MKANSNFWTYKKAPAIEGMFRIIDSSGVGIAITGTEDRARLLAAAPRLLAALKAVVDGLKLTPDTGNSACRRMCLDAIDAINEAEGGQS